MFNNKEDFKKVFTDKMMERYGVKVSDSHITEQY